MLNGLQLWQDLDIQGLPNSGKDFFLKEEGLTAEEIHEIHRRMEDTHGSIDDALIGGAEECNANTHGQCNRNVCSDQIGDITDLAVVLRGEVAEFQLSRLEAFVESTKQNGRRSLVKQRRNFGYDQAAHH